MSKEYDNKSKILEISDEEYLEKRKLLTSFFLDASYMPMTLKQIAAVLNVGKQQLDILKTIINELEKEAFILQDDSKRYILCSINNIFKCILQVKSKKFGFGILDDGEDIYISSNDFNTAMNGDDVLVKVYSEKTDSKSREGKVIKILKRNKKYVVGRYSKNRNFGFVTPIDDKIEDIYIPKKYNKNMKNGQIVEVEILKYADTGSKSEGKISKVICDSDEKNIEVKAQYIGYGLDEKQEFNKFVLDEISNISDFVTEDDRLNKLDRTTERVVTIDGEDAKDLDDGVCVKKLENGNYILSVYIADVSNYVKELTALDIEAISRGTSIYIPSTVIPMLPRKLSNGICSLNEGVDRLTLGIDIEFNNEGSVLDSNIFKAIINVKKRMSYTNVYKVITNQDDEVLADYREFEGDILLMEELARILNNKRLKMGSINFDIPDTKIILDEEGNVEKIAPYEITIANKIIEEFMLAANMEVAKTFFFLNIPFIYRVHEKPDEEKIRSLNEILSNYNKRIKAVNNVQPKALSKILEEITEEEEKQVISTAMLRTLKLARYSEECMGHFGLAAKYYCHFTSPIRRYPDLFIHRIISDYIESGSILTDAKIAKYSKMAIDYSKKSSDAEKEATIIERDFDDLYKAIYMEKFIGEKYEARISSVTSFGMFVKLENTVEGLVPFEYMPGDDYYEYDEVKKVLIGRKTSKIFRIGDKISVELIRCDVKSKQLDFKII